MNEERDGDDLLDTFPVPATEDVLTDEDTAEQGPEGVEGEEHLGLTPPG